MKCKQWHDIHGHEITSHRCKHTHSTLHKYTRGLVDVTAIALIKSCVYPLFDCTDTEKNTQAEKP